MPKHTTPGNVTNLQEYRARKQRPRNPFTGQNWTDNHSPGIPPTDTVSNPFLNIYPDESELCPQCGKRMAGHFIGRKNRYLACDTCRVQMPAGNDMGWHGLLDMAWDQCGPNATSDDVGEWLQGQYHHTRAYLNGYRMIGGSNG